MTFPSLEKYQEALQNPRTALIDSELARGEIAKTGLGLPLALCGGFALTYTVTTTSPKKKFALRCFHKQSKHLDKRYAAIDRRIQGLHSSYFINFEFQARGIKINGQTYPVVKMAWASGETLGEFLEKHHSNPDHVNSLINLMGSLASYLNHQQMAHGDVQPGNVMVGHGCHSIQLIDYDGMFVPDLKSLGSAEFGHRNFQHPKRNNNWDNTLDRFSFIGLNLALRALQLDSSLWNKTQSDGDSILFRAGDFISPEQSPIFNDLFKVRELEQHAKNFASICKANFNQIPTLDHFIAGQNIPHRPIDVLGKTPSKPLRYISAYEVLDATDFMQCHAHVGDRVELIGCVVEVKRGNTKYGKPYVFVNFGPWQGESVKLNIWSEGLPSFITTTPESWKGKWISVIGLMDPPYKDRGNRYTHLSITITQANQVHEISPKEAQFRLASAKSPDGNGSSTSANKKILAGIRGTTPYGTSVGRPTRPSATQNQEVLARMAATRTGPSDRGKIATPPPTSTDKTIRTSASNTGCLVWVLLGGLLFFILLMVVR